jgi:hypothetical protein
MSKVRYKQLTVEGKIDLLDENYKLIKTIEPLKCEICGSLSIGDVCSKKCADAWIKKYLP